MNKHDLTTLSKKMVECAQKRYQVASAKHCKDLAFALEFPFGLDFKTGSDISIKSFSSGTGLDLNWI